MSKPIDAIYNRVSTRAFLKKEIPEEIIYEILKAGTQAPSSGNMQPWEFIVVSDEERKENVVSATFSGFYSEWAPHQKWIGLAPKIIIICINTKRTKSRYAELGDKWTLIDTANAVQNMILTATEYGIGSCWVGGIKEKLIKRFFNIPSYVNPIGLLPIGYPKENVSYKYKMDPKWITHADEYNNAYYLDTKISNE